MTTIQHLNIEVTRRCDQQCEYCFNDSGPSARYPELPLSCWIRYLDHMSSRGLRSFHLTGGEPFVSPVAVPLLRHAQSLDLSTSILSNGLRIPKLALQEPTVLRRLSVAQISLDSMSPAVHDHRRGKPGAWRQAVQAIGVLRGLNVRVEVSCTLDQGNVQAIPALADFVRAKGCSLLLRPRLPLGRASLRGSQKKEGLLSSPDTDVGDILVSDRFRYLPEPASSGATALDDGILTILPDGRFRSGLVQGTDGAARDSVLKVLEAA